MLPYLTIIIIYREILVQLAPQERPAPLAHRAQQENQERKVLEDSQDQWSVKFIHYFCIYQ